MQVDTLQEGAINSALKKQDTCCREGIESLSFLHAPCNAQGLQKAKVGSIYRV